MADITISQLNTGTPNKNTAVIPYSDGTTTLKTNPAGIVAASPGSIIDVKQFFFQDIFTTTSNTYVTIPGFSVAITPKNINNKILVRLSLTGGVYGYFGAVRVYRDETPIGLPFTRPGVPDINRCWFNMYDDYDTNDAKTQSMEFLDSPNTVSQVIYTPRIACVQGGGTFVINDQTSQARNQTYAGNFVSSLTLMEIAG